MRVYIFRWCVSNIIEHSNKHIDSIKQTDSLVTERISFLFFKIVSDTTNCDFF